MLNQHQLTRSERESYPAGHFHENRTRVVANGVHDPVFEPCAYCIAVVQASDSRRDDAVGRKVRRDIVVCEANALEPFLVPSDFFNYIVVSCISFVFVCAALVSIGVNPQRVEAYNVCCKKSAHSSFIFRVNTYGYMKELHHVRLVREILF